MPFVRLGAGLLGGLVLVLAGAAQTVAAQTGVPPIASHARSNPSPPDAALVAKYCVTCHNDRTKTGGLSLAGLDPARGADAAGTWEKSIVKLRGGMMPPQGMPRPDEATLDRFLTSLEATLDRAALASPNPGRASLHRLNRAEYANAIRDLLALDVDVTELLPADDESYGFDNIADVLKVSPSLVEQYLVASDRISRLAVGDPDTVPISRVFRVPPDRSQEQHIEGLPLGTRGGLLVRHTFPLDAEYDVNVKLLRNIVGYLFGLEFAHQLEITIDGERVFVAPVGGEEDNRLSDENMSEHANRIDERLKTRVAITAGPHDVGVAFVQKTAAESDEPLQPFTRDHDLQNMNGIPLVDYVDIRGPFAATGPGDTPSRRRIFSCRPSARLDSGRSLPQTEIRVRNDAGDTLVTPANAGAQSREAAIPSEERGCAKEILTTLARRAYRRPVSGAEVDTLLGFFDAGRAGASFDVGIQHALRFALASPKFLFRSDPDPARAPGTVSRVSDVELASRLSFFLWSSIPDDALLLAAERGTLKAPATLERQVRRMLADPKSQALVSNFAGQWLFLRNLQSFRPDNQEFPDFDDNLRQAFRRETELFVESIMRDNRSVLDLLAADYTFVNGTLARHYGIPNVYGSRFRRVSLANQPRRGLLGQGSVLTVTSYPNRTSPVLRGKWILENILGTPPPAPPPDVPALEETADHGRVLTVRERTEEHRRSPVCASCHKVMDPLGFALENFDAVGRWRVREAGGAVDASGELADGTHVDGPGALRTALLKRPERFVGTMTEKMLIYALGRGLEPYDMPVVRTIVREAEQDDFRFGALVLGVVRSVPFQMRKVEEGSTGKAQGSSVKAQVSP